MRRIIVGTFVSLDGVMQGPGGPEEDRSGGFALGGWTVPFFDEAVGAAMGETFSRPYDLLLGRRTYDIFAAHWPYVTTDPAAPDYDEGNAQIADSFNRVTKYVATHRPESLVWQNSEGLGADVPSRLRQIRAGDGPDLVVQGSSELIQTLLAHDLVDELRLLTFPVLLGKGKRLFGGKGAPAGLKLVSAKSSPSGVVITVHDRAGKVETGSFQLPEPTEAEVARRKEVNA